MIRLVEEVDYRKNTGITRSSIRLPLLHFPQRFPADSMHLVLQNVTPILFKLWIRSRLAVDKLTMRFGLTVWTMKWGAAERCYKIRKSWQLNSQKPMRIQSSMGDESKPLIMIFMNGKEPPLSHLSKTRRSRGVMLAGARTIRIEASLPDTS